MNIQLTEQDIEKALKGFTVPPQPQVLVDIQMEQCQENPSIQQIARLISCDVGLSGAILKLVNSPVYGLVNHITSIEQAVNLLGLPSVINLLNGLSIKSQLADEAIVALNRFWDTAMEVSQISAALAGMVGFKSPDEAYMLGLFHDCGIPMMLQRFGNYLDVLKDSYREDQGRIIDMENRVFNTNHAVVGYFVARAWHLPAHICEAIAEHHNIEAVFLDQNGAADNRKKTLIALLKTASHIAGAWQLDDDIVENREWQVAGSQIMDYIGITDYDLENMIDAYREDGVDGIRDLYKRH